MMSICKELTSQCSNLGTILSPRDLPPKKMDQFGGELHANNGFVLIDPQMYAPQSSRGSLPEYEYRFSGRDTRTGNPEEHLALWFALNKHIHATECILPGRYLKRINEQTLRYSETILELAKEYPFSKLASLCLDSSVFADVDQIDFLLNRIVSWPVDGVYLIADHPDHEYYVEDPVWLYNLLRLCSGIKSSGRKVIVGYSNQQMLCLCCAGVDAIASGTHMNVRTFSLDKFGEEDASFKKRKPWYYCPAALSEFSLQFLDMAAQQNILHLFQTNRELSGGYADILFSGVSPSSTGFSEHHAFRHYLHCLARQCEESNLPSFNARLDQQRKLLEGARKLLAFLHRHGVRGQSRDFLSAIDINLAALDRFSAEHGFLLRHRDDMFS